VFATIFAYALRSHCSVDSQRTYNYFGGSAFMRNISQKTWADATIAFALFVQPVIAFAGTVDGAVPIRVSEPETLALLAVGAVAVIVSRWKKRK
jgi:hypothetical protein